MTKTDNIVYHYDVEGHDVAITRIHVGTAYARNGNVGNPTHYYKWESSIDGEFYGSGYSQRSTAYEYARAHILGIDYYWHDNYPNRAKNVRSYLLVQDEMKANYRRREVVKREKA